MVWDKEAATIKAAAKIGKNHQQVNWPAISIAGLLINYINPQLKLGVYVINNKTALEYSKAALKSFRIHFLLRWEVFTGGILWSAARFAS